MQQRLPKFAGDWLGNAYAECTQRANDLSPRTVAGEMVTGAMSLMPAGRMMPKPSLVVARKMPDGSVRYGKPGQMHSDLFEPHEFSSTVPDSVMGFAEPSGPFLSRQEALKFAAREIPQEGDFRTIRPDVGLEAGHYWEAARGAGMI